MFLIHAYQNGKKTYKFINLTINKKKKFRLEGAGQNLSALNIEDDLMK